MWGTLRHLREYNPAFVSTATDLAQELARQGVTHEMVTLQGAGHAIDRVRRFLKEYL